MHSDSSGPFQSGGMVLDAGCATPPDIKIRGRLAPGSSRATPSRAVNGHEGVIGAGCNGVLVTDNRCYGGNNSTVGQGLVVKLAENLRVENNLITSGYLRGLYLKPAVDCQAFTTASTPTPQPSGRRRP